jgi:outer membrane protein TolC
LQARLVEERRRLLLASPQDASRASAAAAQATLALAEPREAATNAAQALALLLGEVEPDPAWRQPGDLPRLNARPIDAIPAELINA